MQITNRIENGIIATLAMVLTVAIFGFYNHFFVLKPLQNELEAQRLAIVRLAEIPKYSIENDFGKMKAKEGTVNLNLDNSLQVQDSRVTASQTISEPDTILTEAKKRNFWEWVFKRR